MENIIQEALLLEGASISLVGMMFLAGVLTSFTPCVYPMIPITVAVIGNHSQERKQGFYFSLLYVLGLALTYAGLGILAALTGQLFGSIATHPVTLMLVALVLVLMSLWMMGWLKLPQITVGNNYQISSRHRGLSVFILGALSGLVMAPCTSPVLGMLLIFVASKGEAFWGAVMMFVFAFGMSSLLILAGTFSGFVSNLPRSGKWLNKIKVLMAVIMLMAGLYMAWQATGAW